MRIAWRLASSLPALFAIVLLEVSAPAQTLIKYWVDSTNGNDAGPGTSLRPFRTLNHALQVVYDASGSNQYEIGVKASSGPIAPLDFGGQEGPGWLTTQEQTNGCERSPFPIRMLPHVDIVGEIGSSGRPVLTIVEEEGEGQEEDHTYDLWTDTLSQPGGCSTPLERAMVMAASDADFVNFEIDGSQLLSSNPGDTGGSIPGVLIGPVRYFNLVNCEVWDWHEQVLLDPEPNTVTLEANILDCDIHHAWPLDGNQGHAAIMFEGPGDAIVTMDGTTVRNSHDAFEPEDAGGTGSLILTVTNCIFRDNENCFELGGPYEMDIDISDCDFIDNFPHGSSVVSESNVIGLRASTALTLVKVRDSRFSNFSRAACWLADTAESILDLGTESDPGNNTFCLDYTVSSAQTALYRVCILQKSSHVAVPPDPNVISAVGNWWLPNNQGAVGRELSIGQVSGPNVNYPPPGQASAADCFDEGAQDQFPRNYSIFLAGGAIDFGTSSLSGSDPSPCTDCEQQ